MLFNSFEFIGLVLITFALYYTPKLERYQVPILILSSLVFYGFNQPYLVFLLLFSCGINTITSYKVYHGELSSRKFSAVLGVCFNLFLLAIFKYSSLFSETFLEKGSSAGEFLLLIPLPIGISFFTFQGISLLVDVYKDRIEKKYTFVPKSFVEHASHTLFFIAFFPQLVAGPIVKAHEFFPQIQKKVLKDVQWENSFQYIVVGYFLKMVIADNLKDFTFWIEYPYFQHQSTLTLLSMLFGYSMQIFSDFAGYSLIAIGLAKLFGYSLIENFYFPYISTSFSEFWRRWHISLSTFLKEYLYIPLGGNRRGKFRTYINLFITMLLGGLWHGAAWSYLVWGGFHGLALAIEKFLNDKISIGNSLFAKLIQWFIVFTFVTFAWLLFKLPDFKHVLKYFEALSNNWSVPDDTGIIANIIIYSLPVIVYHVLYKLKETFVFTHRAVSLRFVLLGVALFFIIVNSGSSGAFIYFQF